MEKIKVLKKVIGFLIILLLSLIACYACGDSKVTSTFPSSVDEVSPLGRVITALDTETNTVTVQIEMTSPTVDDVEVKLHSSYLNHLNGSENCGDVIATATVSSSWVTFSFENPAVTYAVEDGFRDRFWGTIWSIFSETCNSPDWWFDFWDVELNPYYLEDCDGNGGVEMVFYADRVEVVPEGSTCGEVYEEPESEPEPQGQVIITLDTETNTVTVQIEMTSPIADGVEVKLHSSYLNELYGGGNCEDVIAVSTIVNGWSEFTFENQAVTYGVEDGFRDRSWGTIWYTSSETCDSPDEWMDFTNNLAVNPYYFEDCDGNGGIETVSYSDRIEVVPEGSNCGEVYTP